MKLFVNDLTVMDFSYLCAERGMVGESWIVDIVLDGGLNEESMVQDFGKVKKGLKKVIDDYVDHKLVVPADYAGVLITHDDNQEKVQVDFTFGNAQNTQSIHLYCPDEAYAFVYANEICMQSVTAYLKDVIAIHLPENVHSVDITLREEHIPTPYYHYTHGLKKHDGNCQRIAHGHRSKVVVHENGQESEHWQQYWAERWADIYIGTDEDLVEPQQLSLRHPNINAKQHYCFQYEASQGVFEMAIPKAVTEMVSTDTTVECLAQFMFDEMKKQSTSPMMVKAFEGVGKGAMVSD